MVGGTEYFYGHGINSATPGTTPCGTPVEVIELGCEEALDSGRGGGEAEQWGDVHGQQGAARPTLQPLTLP